ncbi:hypothetical protein ACOWPH_08270 [Anabaena sp. PCC 7938]|uniref:hypothetical protein n=1 Tax=Anabaena TaxID=1163 RepID=UPI0002FDD1F0|nr:MULTISPECIES: hypothetical protein [Anabaena]MCM2406418.1 hypothetical protein [Anabaena sp. CCAP 1446/1C]BAY04723.1 hypothetical protein NIES19_39890 [Anabaena cylindrica PCC 7122]
MTSQQAQSVAQELGDIPQNDEKLQAEIQRLNSKNFIALEQVKMLHDWLDGKRQSRQSGRVLGESRTGKTMGCDPTDSGINPNKSRENRQLCLLLISKYLKNVVLRSYLQQLLSI